jgi:S1-C subfamily serine protease
VPDAATVLTLDGPRDVEILRTGPLVVHDTTERERHEREVHTLTPGVEEGTSGAPLVDEDGRLLGVVVLDNAAGGVAYAVTAAELAGVLDREHRVAAGCPD